MKKNKKIVFAFVFALMSFLLIQPRSQKSFIKQANQQTKKNKQYHNRKPASIKINPDQTQSSQPQQRKIIGNQKNSYQNLKFTNQVNQNGKALYTKNLTRMLKEDIAGDLKIQVKESIIKVKKQTARNLEHVIVSYTKKNGESFSYEALIDSETGTPIKSWNQTRYEFPKSVKLNPNGRLLKNN